MGGNDDKDNEELRRYEAGDRIMFSFIKTIVTIAAIYVSYMLIYFIIMIL